MPHWEISIALEHKGEVVDGVVFDAAKDEMFYAEKGQGAWLNGSQRLRVSGRAKMSDAVYATGLPFGPRPYLPAAQQDLARLLPQCYGVRRWGVASLDLAMAAVMRTEGRLSTDLRLLLRTNPSSSPWAVAQTELARDTRLVDEAVDSITALVG